MPTNLYPPPLKTNPYELPYERPVLRLLLSFPFAATRSLDKTFGFFLSEDDELLLRVSLVEDLAYSLEGHRAFCFWI